MLTELLEIGDRVELNLSQEVRSYYASSNLPPNGVQGIVIGFWRYTAHYELFGNDMAVGKKPGIYQLDGRAVVRWDDDLTAEQENVMRTHSLEMVDKEEYEHRYQNKWVLPVLKERTVSMQDAKAALCNELRIDDLPETRLYPMDKVRFVQPEIGFEYEQVIVSREWRQGDPIRYTVGFYENYGTKDAQRYGTRTADESDLRLVSRGPVWCYYHNEPYEYKSIREEASVAVGLGRSEEIRNPETDKYSWAQEEFKKALKDGTVDAVQVSHLFGNTSPLKDIEKTWGDDDIDAIGVSHLFENMTTTCRRFHDRELGERIRHTTMVGFNLV